MTSSTGRRQCVVEWDEVRAFAAVLRAVHYFSDDPDRCDIEGREREVAIEVLHRLAGDGHVPPLVSIPTPSSQLDES